MSLTHYWMLVDQMARMSLKADASRYFLGYLWWLLEPLLYVAVFFVVFDLILQSRSEDFLVFLICGKFTFIWFSKSVTHASKSITSAHGLIGKLQLPKSLFPLATIQEGLYKQLTVFVLLMLVVSLAGYKPSWAWLWLPPLIAVNYLMIVCCGLIAAFLVCLFFDFNMLVQLGMVFLLFVSGIFWDPRSLPDIQTTELVLMLNPVAFIIDCYRQVLLSGSTPDLSHLATVAIAATIGIVGALHIMRKHSQYIALKVLTI